MNTAFKYYSPGICPYCKVSEVSVGTVASSVFLKTDMREASSANRYMGFAIFSAMSLINIKKSKGPRMEPWVTPAFVDLKEDCSAQLPLSDTALINKKLSNYTKVQKCQIHIVYGVTQGTRLGHKLWRYPKRQ